MENETRIIKQEKIKAFVKKHKLVIIGGGCVALGLIFGYKFGFKSGCNMTAKEFSDSLFMNVKKLGRLYYKMDQYPNLVLEAQIKESLGDIKGTPINLDFGK